MHILKVKEWFMKWMMLIGIGFLLGSCTYYRPEVVQYHQVMVAPAAAIPAINMVSYGTYGVPQPVDITSTNVQYFY